MKLGSEHKLALLLGVSALVGFGVWSLISRRRAKNTPFSDTPSDTDEELLRKAELYRKEGNEHYKAGRYEEATACYDQIIRTYQHRDSDILSIVYANRAAVHLSLQNFEAALGDCAKSLALNPKFTKALDRRSRVLEKLGRLEEALEDAVAVLVIDDSKTEAYFNHVEVLLGKIGEDRAKELYQKREFSLESNWNISKFLRSFRREWRSLQARENSELGVFFGLLQTRRYSEAYKAIRDIALDNASPAVLNWLGTFHFLAGNFSAAKDALTDCISKDPANVSARVKYALVMMELGHYVEMTEALDVAQQTDDTDPSLYYHRGEIFALSSNLEAAVADFSRAIQLDAEYVDAYVHQSRAYVALGMTSVACEFLTRALELLHNDPDLLHALGECLAMEGRQKEAMELFDQVELMAPELPHVALNKAVIQYMLDDSDEHFGQRLEEIVKRFPNFDAAHVQLAGHLILKKRIPEAMGHYDIAAKHARSFQELVTVCTLRAISEAQARVAEKYPDLVPAIQ